MVASGDLHSHPLGGPDVGVPVGTVTWPSIVSVTRNLPAGRHRTLPGADTGPAGGRALGEER